MKSRTIKTDIGVVEYGLPRDLQEITKVCVRKDGILFHLQCVRQEEVIVADHKVRLRGIPLFFYIKPVANKFNIGLFPTPSERFDVIVTYEPKQPNHARSRYA